MLNHGVVQLHSSYCYLISILKNHKILRNFIEHHNICTMILISRKYCKLITQSVFLTFIHHSMFYCDANPILVLLLDCVTDKNTYLCKINVFICMKGKALSKRYLS